MARSHSYLILKGQDRKQATWRLLHLRISDLSLQISTDPAQPHPYCRPFSLIYSTRNRTQLIYFSHPSLTDTQKNVHPTFENASLLYLNNFPLAGLCFREPLLIYPATILPELPSLLAKHVRLLQRKGQMMGTSVFLTIFPWSFLNSGQHTVTAYHNQTAARF